MEEIIATKMAKLLDAFPSHYAHQLWVRPLGVNPEKIEELLKKLHFNVCVKFHTVIFCSKGTLEFDNNRIHSPYIQYYSNLFLPLNDSSKYYMVSFENNDKSLPIGISNCHGGIWNDIACWDKDTQIMPQLQRDIFTAVYGSEWHSCVKIVLYVNNNTTRSIENGPIKLD